MKGIRGPTLGNRVVGVELYQGVFPHIESGMIKVKPSPKKVEIVGSQFRVVCSGRPVDGGKANPRIEQLRSLLAALRIKDDVSRRTGVVDDRFDAFEDFGIFGPIEIRRKDRIYTWVLIEALDQEFALLGVHVGVPGMIMGRGNHHNSRLGRICCGCGAKAKNQTTKAQGQFCQMHC